MTSTALVPLTTIDAAVQDAMDRVLHDAALPSLLRPSKRRLPDTDGNDDPAILGFPPTLPVELAMREQPRNAILQCYGIGPEQWDVLRANPVFQKALKDAVEMLQRHGMSFRVKAGMQAEALLETNWKLIHSATTPAAVKADLIKNTFKVAGLEPKEQANATNPLQININLG